MALLLPLMPWRKDTNGLGMGEPIIKDPALDSGTLFYDHFAPEHLTDYINIAMLIVFVSSFVFNSLLFPLSGPSALCDFAVYGALIFSAASNISRCAIALDRHIFISDPLRYYQRIQGFSRAFTALGMLVFDVALIMVPYIFLMRQESSHESCLPAYPKTYKLLVMFLLYILPSLFLIVIYTRIFYWAFLQMQILRQEAKHFLDQQERGTVASTPSVSSKQLRSFTGAAMLLTPSSPFSTRGHSLELQNPQDAQRPHIHTAIHKITHILYSLKLSLEDEGQSIVSTGVDKTNDAATTGNNLFLQTHNDNSVCAVEKIMKSDDCIKLKVRDTNENAKHFNAKKTKDTSTTPSTPSTSSRLQGASPIDGTIHETAVDDYNYGLGMTGRDFYKPVTPQGKWMKSRLNQYDFDVVRETIISPPRMGKYIFCNLLKAEIKAVVMIMALMGSFVLCWMPFLIIVFIEVFEFEDVTAIETRICITLAILNCVLDPFSYALMNPPFRAVVSQCIGGSYRKYREPYKFFGQHPMKKTGFGLTPSRLKSIFQASGTSEKAVSPGAFGYGM
ncbi:5-hydroxytryptamine receptor [Plakobranchus ocellatus]|uniref:5-hydroxytryptamine receptor n=1 Tax=Plakobranchus ocellatus TaxID=259542 RepID=A0AAV4D599_9GAST|nr:5-hydroxytryptamine receptor [Plakobranchus ocellatus]